MTQKISAKLLTLVFSVLILCFLATLYIFAWTEPTTTPPGGNVPAPINVGPSKQWKLGITGPPPQYPAIGVYAGTSAPYSLPPGAIAANIFTDSDNINYYVNPAGTTSAILAGRVGIGPTSPQARLDIAGGGLVITGFDDIHPLGGLVIGHMGSTAMIRSLYDISPLPIDIYASAVRISRFTFGVPDRPFFVAGTIGVERHTATFEGDPWPADNWRRGVAIGELRTVGGEVLRSIQAFDRSYDGTTISYTDLVINSYGGNVGIGTTSPGWLLQVNGSAAKPGGGSWTDSSDIRLKKNIKPIENALEKMLSLEGVSFEWAEPERVKLLPGEQIGMTAQDVEQVFPQWVGTDENGYKDLTFRGFEALTVEAVRELKAENEALKQRIQVLEAKLNAGQ